MEIQPKVLIVILNYVTYQLTINLVKELHEKLEYKNYSIMVIDNCSPNESSIELGKKSAELKYIFYSNKINSGYASGNNIGIRFGINHGYDYSLILNNDVEIISKNFLNHMLQIAESNKKIGSIGPKIYNLDGSICAPYCRRPTFMRLTLGLLAEKRFRTRFIDKSGEVYRLYGCCMLLKNEIMADVNCMDERTFLYEEEDILAERMLQKGYISYYDAEVNIIHKESSTVKKASKNRKKFQAKCISRSMDIYLKEYLKWGGIRSFFCKVIRIGIIFMR